jgi:hypothetical protein
MRESRAYQRGLQLLKWRIAPVTLGFVMLIGLMLVGLALVAQARILLDEEASHFCSQPRNPLVATGPATYRTNILCNPTGMHVNANHDYDISFTPDPGGEWRDGGPNGDGVSATLAGVEAAQEVWVMKLTFPLKRVMTARYLQPIALIAPGGTKRVSITRLEPVDRAGGVFVARLRAPVSGRLMLFANDAIPPFGIKNLFYQRNLGSAAVVVTEVAPPSASAGSDASLARLHPSARTAGGTVDPSQAGR